MRRSIWLPATSICVILRSTVSTTCVTTTPVTSGASIRCMTSRTRSKMHLKVSHTPSARSSLRHTDRCMTGSSRMYPYPRSPVRSSLQDWVSPIRYFLRESSATWSRQVLSTDGTIRVCLPCVVCAAADTHRHQSITSIPEMVSQR